MANTLYVDLEGIDATGVTTGTADNPISFEQMRSYLVTDLEAVNTLDHTFIIKGVYNDVVDYGDGLADTGIFNMRYDSLRYITFTNWLDDTPYTMNISVTTSGDVDTGTAGPPLHFVNSGNVVLKINNMELQTSGFSDIHNGSPRTRDIGNIVIRNDYETDGSNSHDNRVEINNGRLFTNGNGYVQLEDIGVPDFLYSSFYFSGYEEVHLYNSLFYSELDNSHLSIRGYYDNDDWQYPSGFGEFEIINSIILNVENMYRFVNGDPLTETLPTVVINNNVFSETANSLVSTVVRPNDYANLMDYNSASNVTTNQFEFPVPSLSLTGGDYRYVASGWELITITGNQSIFINQYGYNTRDGVGALLFPTIPAPVVASNDYHPIVGQTIALSNSVVDYDNDYQPSAYEWTINTDNYTTSAGSLNYQITTSNIYDVSLYATSYNAWYDSATAILQIKVTETPNIDVVLVDSDGNEASTYTVFDTVGVSATNLGTSPIASYGVDWGESCGDTTTILAINGDGDIEHVYTSVDEYVVKYSAIMEDGGTHFTYLPITINDNVSPVYYVDLSQEYEDNKWLTHNYGVYDTFENGYISNQLLPSFISNYSVKDMWGDKVAYGTLPVLVYDSVGFGDFDMDLSMVREDEADNPTVTISLVTGSTPYDVIVEWDFIKDSLFVSVGSVERRRIRYGSFIKDLLCPNTIRSIYINSVYTSESETMDLYYKLNSDDDWAIIATGMSVGPFDYATLSTECTSDTGLGYVRIQHDEVVGGNANIQGNGTTLNPYTYTEMVERLTTNDISPINSRFLCRNSRETSDIFQCYEGAFYEIGAWDSTTYGPWIISHFEFGGGQGVFDFGGTKLSNGIIYNYTEDSSYLVVSHMCDMFIVWNGAGNILLHKTPWKYTGLDKRVDIKGCTIRANNDINIQEG